MNEPIIRKASRKKAKLRLGISAPSGAGKTLGALLLAYGMMKEAHPNASDAQLWEKIGMMDTEEGSGELYVGVYKHGITIGEYQYIRISNNYDPVNYINSIHAFERAGVEVIIADSLTHAWAGQGGLLEKQGKLTDADKYKNSYTAWRTITPQHDALVGSILQSSCHIIGTMRSKVEYAMQNDLKGKAQVVKLGMAPIQREGMEYEFTAFFDISSDSIATATKDRTDLFSIVNAANVLEKRSFIIRPQVGAELMRWLNTGVESLDSLCERLAAEIAVSTDLNATYAAHEATMARMTAEKPEYCQMMNDLFAARDAELQNTVKAV